MPLVTTKIFHHSILFLDKAGADATRQLKDIKSFIKDWKSTKNLILVTHQVVISFTSYYKSESLKKIYNPIAY